MSVWDWFSDDSSRAKSGVMAGESLKKWHDDVDQWFDNTMKEISNFRWSGAKHGEHFQPKTDLSETAKHYKITVEVPGVNPQDLRLEIENHTITVSGEKKSSHEEKGNNMHKVECEYGHFERVMALPEDADMDTIQAEFSHGALHITISRSGTPSSKKQVEIQMK